MEYKNEYELIYIVPGEKVETVPATRETIKKIIEKHSGEIKKESEPQKRKLAYVVKGSRNGIYIIVRFTLLEKENLKALYNDIKLDSAVLRHLIVKAQELPKEKKRPKSELDKIISEDKDEKQLLEEIQAKKVQEEKKEEEKPAVAEPVETPVSEPEKEEKEPKEEVAKKEIKAKEVDKEKEEEKKAKKKDKKEKMKFEDLDKKLDDILKDDLI